MDESNYDADGNFTDKYKFRIMIHPVVQELFDIALIRARKQQSVLSCREVHDKFFEALERSSEKFSKLELEAFDESEIVQDGLRLANDVLYQFTPEIKDFQTHEQNYVRINKIFWGKYFYRAGLNEATRIKEIQEISPWEVAKYYANEFWKFGQSEFPETIRLGFIFLLENDPNNKLNFSRITGLLDRFGYSRETQLGFFYFLGLTAMVGVTGESADDLQKRIWRLPTVDINIEFQELLGPLRNVLLHEIYDELVWRCNGKIEVREIIMPNSGSRISEYKFKNHFTISADDRKVKNLKDVEEVFTLAMSKLGQEFVKNHYDPIEAFKTGVCASNVRAQFDTKACASAAGYLKKFIPLIFSAAHRMTLQQKISWDGYLDIQVPLQQFLSELPHDLGKMVWNYQSFIFFLDGMPKQGIEDLDTMQFMKECKSMAVKFFHYNIEHCRSIAARKLHWTSFPHLQKDQDERLIILEAIKINFGFSEQTNTKADNLSLKAVIIFAYFCSLCETISFEDQPPLLH